MKRMIVGYVEIDPAKLKAARLGVKPCPPRLSDAARFLGVKPQRLWNWENIYTVMTEDALKKACKLYKVNKADIVTVGASAEAQAA